MFIRAGTHFNPIVLRKAKIVYNFGLSRCIRVKLQVLPWYTEKLKKYEKFTHKFWLIFTFQPFGIYKIYWIMPAQSNIRNLHQTKYG